MKPFIKNLLRAKIVGLIFFCLIFQTSKAQNSQFENLVFEGAGIRGIAYVGVMDELEQSHRMPYIKRIGGTSAGAIIALAVAIGYTAPELKQIIYNTNFAQFNDGQWSIIGGFHRVHRNFGWYRGQKFANWVGQLIASKTGSSETTFEELHSKGFKDVYITATSLNQQKALVFSYQTFPKMKLKDAVRISMSIPLYFEAVKIDSIGQVIKKSIPGQSFHVCVDGGITMNFPISIFDSTYKNQKGDLQRNFNTKTLGFRMDSDGQIALDKKNHTFESYDVKSFKQYVQAFYVYSLESNNRNNLVSDDWLRTVSISSSGISPILKKLSNQQKDILIKNGKKATKEFLGRRK